MQRTKFKDPIKDFPLILLAGGRSSRMGTPKGLLDFHGRPWLIEQLRRFKAASGKRGIIVLGFHQAHYFEQIPWLVNAVTEPVQQLGLEISAAINQAPEQGQFSSLQCAIASLKLHTPSTPMNHDKFTKIRNRSSFRRKPESSILLRCQKPWMPDQVRHDGERTASRPILDSIVRRKEICSGSVELRTARLSLFDKTCRRAQVESLKAQSGLDLSRFEKLKALNMSKGSPMVLSTGSPKSPNSELFFSNSPIPGAFTLPIDVPCPGKGVFERLIGAFHNSIDTAIPQYQSKGGHPVLLGGDFLCRLAEVPLTSHLARLDLQIRSLPKDRIALVSVNDKSICLNMNFLDEFQDYAQGEKEA